jgi:hypothetical protein
MTICTVQLPSVLITSAYHYPKQTITIKDKLLTLIRKFKFEILLGVAGAFMYRIDEMEPTLSF